MSSSCRHDIHGAHNDHCRRTSAADVCSVLSPSTMPIEVAYSFFEVEGYTLKGLFHEIRDVKGELENVQAFLCAAKRLRDIDEAIESCL